MIAAIQTRYAGYLFRSRLEARWAVFFDKMKLDWSYEPEGFQLKSGKFYLPDFRVNFKRGPIWFEIKPAKEESKLLEELITYAPCNWSGAVLNDIPDPRVVEAEQHYYARDDRPHILFGAGPDAELDPDGPYPGRDTSYQFCICESCSAVGFEFDGRSARIGCGCAIHKRSDKNYTSNHPRILAAFAAARSARFEHEHRERYETI